MMKEPCVVAKLLSLTDILVVSWCNSVFSFGSLSKFTGSLSLPLFRHWDAEILIIKYHERTLYCCRAYRDDLNCPDGE